MRSRKNLIPINLYPVYIDLQKINEKYKLIYQLCSELQVCSGGGGCAANATQLNKVNKDTQERRILKKMIVCIKNMYRLIL